jgi:hypothetical protein
MYHLEWQEPWQELTEADQTRFEAELRKELGPTHPLFGIEANAVGKSSASDDVLFQLQGTEASYVLVHLTWTGGCDANGVWPTHEFYHSWQDFVTHRMQHDAFGYAE